MMNSSYDYQVRISKLNEKDGGGYFAIVPELPGCISDGETYEEALADIQEAIHEWIETAKERGQNIPEPLIYEDENNFSGKLLLRIPKKLHKELYISAEEQGVSLNQLILYYLSKEVGLGETKRETSTAKDLAKKEGKIEILDEEGAEKLKMLIEFVKLQKLSENSWKPINIGG